MSTLIYDQLAEYFSGVWQSNLDQYCYTGWHLVDKVNPGETVLDVGCGYNEFKSLVPNLIGIDPYNNKADINVSIEDYQTDQQFDVIFCLGAINFGSREKVRSQVRKMITHLKPGGRIYWRQNPGFADHQNQECLTIDFYNWTFMDNYNFAFENNCTVDFIDLDCNRYYAEWTKCMK